MAPATTLPERKARPPARYSTIGADSGYASTNGDNSSADSQQRLSTDVRFRSLCQENTSEHFSSALARAAHKCRRRITVALWRLQRTLLYWRKFSHRLKTYRQCKSLRRRFVMNLFASITLEKCRLLGLKPRLRRRQRSPRPQQRLRLQRWRRVRKALTRITTKSRVLYRRQRPTRTTTSSRRRLAQESLSLQLSPKRPAQRRA